MLETVGRKRTQTKIATETESVTVGPKRGSLIGGGGAGAGTERGTGTGTVIETGTETVIETGTETGIETGRGLETEIGQNETGIGTKTARNGNGPGAGE